MQLTQWQESIAVVPGNKVGGRAEGGEFAGGGGGGGGSHIFVIAIRRERTVTRQVSNIQN